MKHDDVTLTKLILMCEGSYISELFSLSLTQCSVHSNVPESQPLYVKSDEDIAVVPSPPLAPSCA